MHIDDRYRYFHKELYNSSRQTFSSIARHLRKTIIKPHMKCVRKIITDAAKDPEYIDHHDICPIAYSYLLWKCLIQDISDYWKIDSGWTPVRRHDTNYKPFTKFDFDLMQKIYDQLIFALDGHSEIIDSGLAFTKWVINRIEAHHVYNHFKWIIRFASELIAEKKMSEPMTVEPGQPPIYLIAAPDGLDGKLEFHWWGRDMEYKTEN